VFTIARSPAAHVPQEAVKDMPLFDKELVINIGPSVVIVGTKSEKQTKETDALQQELRFLAFQC
jgi:hypothetical protein